jgi:hypothetical protein
VEQGFEPSLRAQSAFPQEKQGYAAEGEIGVRTNDGGQTWKVGAAAKPDSKPDYTWRLD